MPMPGDDPKFSFLRWASLTELGRLAASEKYASVTLTGLAKVFPLSVDVATNIWLGRVPAGAAGFGQLARYVAYTTSWSPRLSTARPSGRFFSMSLPVLPRLTLTGVWAHVSPS